ncbi:hypothetical protein [Streptomyces niveus]|uniref:hypothetical protein n=1 Tax=Streptomyces niveus TaxID=193462 RepID=UPI0003C5FFB6|nr:hypothetical protein [Streptomyces niveus]EST19647.1 hypothetical protein M877_35735 [Streptomyces niveus NCIMB 11891]
MQINGEAQDKPGTALLLVAAPAGKGRLTDAGSVIPVLAAVSPAVLAGTATATLIELADPLDPQAVLTRIRGAAASDGPLTVVLVGQLQLDRRQRAVHLALARTTPSTLRYTALPWDWLVNELRQRRPGTTTLYVDLVADAEVWQLLGREPLELPNGARTYGVIAPPPGRRRTAQPAYTHALAQILRTGRRSGPDELHHDALQRAATVEKALVLGPEHPAVQPPPAEAPPVHVPVEDDPHGRIAALSQAGHHREAVALALAAEQRAVQSFGADTLAAVHWVEVRAHLASVANDPDQSCALWLHTAQIRLDTLRQAPDTPDVETAVDRAHHQWDRIRNATHARRLAPQLVAQRRRVPGRQRAALDAIQKKLERLNSLPPG